MSTTKSITELTPATTVGDADLLLVVDQTTNSEVPTGKKLEVGALRSYVSQTQRIDVADNDSLVATRRGINFLDGTAVAVTATDDAANNRVDVTLNLVASGVAINSLDGSTPLTVAKGGTGGADAGTARTNIGAAAAGDNTDITSLTGLTTALAVDQGGTGATTALNALNNLGGVNTAANVGVGGVGVFEQKVFINGSNRLEFRSIAAGAGGYVSVTHDDGNNEIELNVSPNAILNAASQNIDLNGFQLKNIDNPSDASDAATKAYVDLTPRGSSTLPRCA